MFLKDGVRFIDEYLFTHILNRAARRRRQLARHVRVLHRRRSATACGCGPRCCPPRSPPRCCARARDTREGRVRFMIALWAIVRRRVLLARPDQVPPLHPPGRPGARRSSSRSSSTTSVARRDRLHPLYAALGIGIVLLICRDLMYEPERWIEMFVFRYDRPWPSGEPWSDRSVGRLPRARRRRRRSRSSSPRRRWRRIGVAALGAAGLAICIWALQVYMPIAGTHWGMREAVRTYYEQRTIYGEKLVYFGARRARRRLARRRRSLDVRDVRPRHAADRPADDDARSRSRKADDERVIEQTIALVGTVDARSAITQVEVTLAPGRAREARCR